MDHAMTQMLKVAAAHTLNLAERVTVGHNMVAAVPTDTMKAANLAAVHSDALVLNSC